jgi:hypothetical protein
MAHSYAESYRFTEHELLRAWQNEREREREREREKGEKDGKDSLPPLLFLTKSTVDFFDKLHSRPAVPAFV